MWSWSASSVFKWLKTTRALLRFYEKRPKWTGDPANLEAGQDPDRGQECGHGPSEPNTYSHHHAPRPHLRTRLLRLFPHLLTRSPARPFARSSVRPFARSPVPLPHPLARSHLIAKRLKSAPFSSEVVRRGGFPIHSTVVAFWIKKNITGPFQASGGSGQNIRTRRHWRSRIQARFGCAKKALKVPGVGFLIVCMIAIRKTVDIPHHPLTPHAPQPTNIEMT